MSDPNVDRLVQILTSRIEGVKSELSRLLASDYQASGTKKAREIILGRLEALEKDIRDRAAAGTFDATSAAQTNQQVVTFRGVVHNLRASSFRDAPWWVLPLVSEAARLTDVYRLDRSSAIISMQDNSEFQLFTLFTSPRIAIFLCPKELDVNPLLASLLFHEVGHAWVYAQEATPGGANSYLKEVYAADKMGKEAAIITELGKGQPNDLFSPSLSKPMFRSALNSHIVELTCDEIGRSIMGIFFDIALIMFFSSRKPSAVSETHPSDTLRLTKSIERLKTAELLPSAVSNGVTPLLAQVRAFGEYIVAHCTNVPQVPQLADILGRAESLANELVISWVTDAKKKKPQTVAWLKNSLDVDAIFSQWQSARKHVELMIPLFEIIDSKNKNEAALQPIESLALNTLAMIDNSLLKDDPDADRRRIASHARASIDLSPVVVSAKQFVDAREDVKKKQGKAEGLSAMWAMRYQFPSDTDLLLCTPTLDPYAQATAGSIDLRLGTHFLFTENSDFPYLNPNPRDKEFDLVSGGERPPLDAFYKRTYRAFGERIILHPHQFVLAVTLEYIVLPHNLYATVLGRSSWGRLGLTIATATAVSPGFKGRLTLELRNLGETPIPLTVGARVAQLALVSIRGFGGYTKRKGSKYIGPVECEVSRIRRDDDWDFIADVVSKLS